MEQIQAQCPGRAAVRFDSEEGGTLVSRLQTVRQENMPSHLPHCHPEAPSRAHPESCSTKGPASCGCATLAHKTNHLNMFFFLRGPGRTPP